MVAGKHQSTAKWIDFIKDPKVQKIAIIAGVVLLAAALVTASVIFIFGGKEDPSPSQPSGFVDLSDTTGPTEPATEPTQPTEPPEPTRIAVTAPDGSPARDLLLTAGEPLELTVQITPDTVTEGPVWTCSDESVVTLELFTDDASRILLTGAAAGSAVITAAVDGAIYEFTVTVEEPIPPEPEYVNPLTGLPTDTDVSEYRPYAVMLNNIKKATPQVGISQADMIFEIPVEGNITRLMGIYQGFKDAVEIGSIRSSRPYFINIALGFDAIYIHAGGSDDAYALLKSSGITHIDGTNGTSATFHQDKTRLETMGYEHSLMLDVPTVEPYLTGKKATLTHRDGYSAGFTFAEHEDRTGSSALSVEVKFNSSKSTFFDYDAATGLYKVSQFDSPMVDGATGEQLAVRNVITLSIRLTRISGDTAGRLQATLTGSGTGWYLCDGVMTQISWMRTSDSSQFKLTDENGKALVLAPGTTYFAILPTSSGSVQVIS